jgi:hypothetical protein
MHYAPSPYELAALEGAAPDELLNYFLTRAMEVEEVWGLSTGSRWAMKEVDGKTVLPVWPYAQLAQACAEGEWQVHTPDAVSLEHFVYNTLQQLIDDDIHIEVMASGKQQGLMLTAEALFEIIERKMDTGEYFLEG